MSPKGTLASQISIPNELKISKELVYDKCGFELTNYTGDAESLAYGACSFHLNGNRILFRVAKITPTKTGQFVATWKRNEAGKTSPFDFADDLDFVIITAISGSNFGQFIFPKSVLAEKGIISQNGKAGKRGIRVYPPWDSVNNKQAQRTQDWQVDYFLTIKAEIPVDLFLMAKLLPQISRN